MIVKKIDKENERLYQDFIEENPEAKIQHTLKWKEAIEKTYKNCKAYYYLLINNKIKKIKVIFPFFLIKSKLFGNRLISQPFLDFGGPVGKIDKNNFKIIFDEIKNGQLKLEHIEIRFNNFQPNYKDIENILLELGFKKELKRDQFILKLKNEEELWKNFHKHTRNDIRKAEKSNLEIKEIEGKKELNSFYFLYFKSMKSFGSPQHSKKFFENLWKNLYPDMIKGFNCYFQNKTIASIIGYLYKDCVYVIYSISNPKYRQCRPNDLLYWTFIKWSIKNNYKFFDLGQVEKDAKKGSHAYGIYKFKSKWLGNLYERPYFYYYFKEQIKDKEEKNKYKKMIKIWQKLPTFIIKIIGPKICSQLAL